MGEAARSNQEHGFGGTDLSPSTFFCCKPWASLLVFRMPSFSRCDLAPQILLLTSGSEDGGQSPTPKCVSNDSNSCMTLGRSCVFTVSGQSFPEPGQAVGKAGEGWEGATSPTSPSFHPRGRVQGERRLGLVLDIREPWACPHLKAKELVSVLLLGSSWSQPAGELEGAPNSL